MAYNFASHGVISLEDSDAPGSESPAPTRLREPLPPTVIAAYLKALEALRGPFSLSLLERGPGARLVKGSNIIWGIVLSLSVYAALSVFTKSYTLGMIGALAAGLIMRTNWLYTEPAAQALLALFSLLFMLAFKSRHPLHWALAGICLGALILTKAVFLYIGIVLAGGFGLLLLYRLLSGGRALRMAAGFALFLAGTAAIVAPWMARNYHYFGYAGITERGGGVLLIRATKNLMTWEDYIGAIYAWAPGRLTRRVAGWALGYSKQDLAKGGKLERLNRDIPEDLHAVEAGSPESAISYFAKARAQARRFHLDAERQDERYPRGVAEGQIRSHALQLILDQPIEHLSMIPLFLWRGAPLTTLVLCLVGAFALQWRRYDLIIYMLPALGLIAFLALATHFLLRYGEPATPIALVLAISFGQALYLRWRGTSGEIRTATA
jgi:hypothetical protein